MLNLAWPEKASGKWLLQGCAVLSLVIAAGAASADDISDASQMLRSGQHQQALERVNRS
jgi:hypothetical protein